MLVCPPSERRVIVVGAGIAGLAAAARLSADGYEVHIHERESTWCTHASGHNAAMFRHVEASAALTALALRSAAAYQDACGTGWKTDAGGLYVGGPDGALEALEQNARAAGLACETGDAPALLKAHGVAGRASAAERALFVPDDGVIDIHFVAAALRQRALEGGSQIHCGDGVRTLARSAGGGFEAVLESGRSAQAARVVIAAGAWAGPLGAQVGAPLALLPLRRHLLFLRGDAPPPAAPHVWFVDDEFYARPEGSGHLLSPCDESPRPPGCPGVAQDALGLAAERIAARLPRLEHTPMQRAWACLRTFADDRDLVIGEDPRCPGLFWMAGLGGHGMTLAAGAAEVLAARFAAPPASDAPFAVERLLSSPALVKERADAA